jgi:hypothetical protein
MSEETSAVAPRLSLGENLAALRAALRPRWAQPDRRWDPLDAWFRLAAGTGHRAGAEAAGGGAAARAGAAARERGSAPGAGPQGGLLDLMDRANRPYIVTEEDGSLSYGETFHQAEALEDTGAVDEAERRLVDFLRAHRDELEADPGWRGQLASWFGEDAAEMGVGWSQRTPEAPGADGPKAAV